MSAINCARRDLGSARTEIACDKRDTQQHQQVSEERPGNVQPEEQSPALRTPSPARPWRAFPLWRGIPQSRTTLRMRRDAQRRERGALRRRAETSLSRRRTQTDSGCSVPPAFNAKNSAHKAKSSTSHEATRAHNARSVTLDAPRQATASPITAIPAGTKVIASHAGGQRVTNQRTNTNDLRGSDAASRATGSNVRRNCGVKMRIPPGLAGQRVSRAGQRERPMARNWLLRGA